MKLNQNHLSNKKGFFNGRKKKNSIQRFGFMGHIGTLRTSQIINRHAACTLMYTHTHTHTRVYRSQKYTQGSEPAEWQCRSCCCWSLARSACLLHKSPRSRHSPIRNPPSASPKSGGNGRAASCAARRRTLLRTARECEGPVGARECGLSDGNVYPPFMITEDCCYVFTADTLRPIQLELKMQKVCVTG